MFADDSKLFVIGVANVPKLFTNGIIKWPDGRKLLSAKVSKTEKRLKEKIYKLQTKTKIGTQNFKEKWKFLKQKWTIINEAINLR